jgi:hypothetical protein
MLNKQLDYYKKKNYAINDTKMNMVRKKPGFKANHEHGVEMQHNKCHQ